MEWKLLFGVLSGALGLAFAVPYVIDIFRGKTQPHLYSWVIWSTLQVLAVVAMLRGGSGFAGAAGLFLGACSCILISLLALRYGTKNITRMDRVCLIGAFVAIGLYLFMESALLSVIAVTLIDFVGFIPTLRKTYEEPESETLSTWVISGGSNFFGILALQNYTWVTALYMCSLLFTNLLCAGIILVRRRMVLVKGA